ncbi:MAG: NAD(+) synthase, partial [Clostridiales bacterium]|nr:NAD(+) synthase [Clostridiales bacterium]
MSNLGFIRLAAITPKLKPANTEYNSQQIIECLALADRSGCGIAVLPELCVTGASCGDLFLQDFLYERSAEALRQILGASKSISSAVVLGFYMKLAHSLANCAAFIQNGQIKGIVPKMFIPSQQSKWFAPGTTVFGKVKSVNLMGQDVPFGHLLFKDSRSGIAIGIEISEDASRTITPGSLLSLNGAQIIANPSASHDAAGSAASRMDIVCCESRKNICGYVLASAGVHESTTDAVCGGHSIIAENGEAISESIMFSRDS